MIGKFKKIRIQCNISSIHSQQKMDRKITINNIITIFLDVEYFKKFKFIYEVRFTDHVNPKCKSFKKKSGFNIKFHIISEALMKLHKNKTFANI